jgi:hypothetical protein
MTETLERDPVMRLEVVTLTPSDAEKLLITSAAQRQRALSQTRVQQLARLMRDGQFRVTHQPIAIDPNGILIDGQHRVAGIAASGVNVEILVAYDADPETFDLIDTGRTRSPAQTLQIAGYANTNVVAAAARYYLVYRFMEGATRVPGPEVRSRFTSHDILRFMESPAGERVLAELPNANRIAGSLGRHGIITWMSAALAILRGTEAESATREEFMEKLETGSMLPSGSPILALRRWISSETGYVRVRRDMAGFSGMANVAKAWNAYIANEQIHLMSFKPGHEPLPTMLQIRDVAA